VPNNKKRGLGKGIGSLLDDYSYEFNREGAPVVDIDNKVVDIDISCIQPNPNQPRKNFDIDSLSELASSIKANGIIQPLIVEKVVDDKYSIIAGERRYRAAKMAGLKTVPVILRSFSDVQRLEVSLIENIQREALNPVEEAKAYKYLLTEKELTQEELSERVGKSRSAIANSVRILQLPTKMQEALENGTLSAGHGRAILSVVNPADQQILFSKLMKDGLSVRETEKLASELNHGKRIVIQSDLPEKEKKQKAPEILEIEERFVSVVGAKVQIKGKTTKGKIEIPYDNLDELERIFQLFSHDESLFGDNEEE
jgi:ParB family transcriptional regulator, chromosome partitioning protein